MPHHGGHARKHANVGREEPLRKDYGKRAFQEVAQHGDRACTCAQLAIDGGSSGVACLEESLVHMQRPFDAEFILARPDDPKIPFESVDIIFVCNTYHHLEDRTEYFRNVRSSLKPAGRLVVIDYYHDDRSGELSFPKRHLVAREKVVQEMTGAGYRLAREHTFLAKQYFLEFVGAQDR